MVRALTVFYPFAFRELFTEGQHGKDLEVICEPGAAFDDVHDFVDL